MKPFYRTLLSESWHDRVETFATTSDGRGSVTNKKYVLQDSFDKGEWKSVKNFKHDMGIAKKAAKNTLSKDARINIRLSSTQKKGGLVLRPPSIQKVSA
jgi:hypothetical protein